MSRPAVREAVRWKDPRAGSKDFHNEFVPLQLLITFMRMDTRFLVSYFVMLATLATGTAAAQQYATSGIETIDRIVAVVNENVVTRYELNEVLKATVKQLQKQGVQPPAP